MSYASATATTLSCPHAIKRRTENGYEWLSTWQKYRVDKYAGRIERCSLCKERRILDTSSDGAVGYIEQASLFEVN